MLTKQITHDMFCHMEKMLKLSLLMLAVGFCNGCASDNTTTKNSSQLPWAKPAKWEGDRTLTQQDMSFSTQPGKRSLHSR